MRGNRTRGYAAGRRAYAAAGGVRDAGTSEGAGRPRNAAAQATVRESNTSRSCWRSVVTTVSKRSAKRLPSALCVPKLRRRQTTARRSALGGVVRGLHTIHGHKGPQGRRELEDVLAGSACLGVVQGRPFLQQRDLLGLLLDKRLHRRRRGTPIPL
jgi:hypothetical protein